MKTLILALAVSSIFYVTSCSSSKSASSAPDNNSSNTEMNVNNATDLAEYLSRIPGLYVSGQGSSARVTIRGRSSLINESEPLFVINGTPINGGLSQATSLVPIHDIKSVRVLTSPSETTMYGIRAGNGIIEIKLKSGT